MCSKRWKTGFWPIHLSESCYIRAGIRLDTPPAGPNRTFAAFSLTKEALENLDLESNLYLGEDSEALVELDAEYELEISHRIALTGTWKPCLPSLRMSKLGLARD